MVEITESIQVLIIVTNLRKKKVAWRSEDEAPPVNYKDVSAYYGRDCSTLY